MDFTGANKIIKAVSMR